MSEIYFFDVFEFSRPLWATKKNSKSGVKVTAFSTTSGMSRMTLGPKLYFRNKRKLILLHSMIFEKSIFRF